MAHGHNIIGFSVTLLGMFTRILEVGLGRTFDRLRLWMNGFSATAWPSFTWILKGFSASAWYFYLNFEWLQRIFLVFSPGIWKASVQLLSIFTWILSSFSATAHYFIPGFWVASAQLLGLSIFTWTLKGFSATDKITWIWNGFSPIVWFAPCL